MDISMVIVELIGGLGNQMFQYALGRSLALRAHQQLKLNIHTFDSQNSIDTRRYYDLYHFAFQPEFASETEVYTLKFQKAPLIKRLLRLLQKKTRPVGSNFYKESSYSFSSDILTINEDTYLKGYWQSYKYFEMHADTIKSDFTLREPLSETSLDLMATFSEQTTVSIHIRRGDYLSNAEANATHGLCSITYYKKAIEYMTQHLSSPYFVLFSDDVVWVKDNFSFLLNATVIDLPQDTPDYEEMIIMSKCDHNIIANSSFSWWAAWLNQNSDKKVIAPQQWFKDSTIDTSDLIPKEWIKL